MKQVNDHLNIEGRVQEKIIIHYIGLKQQKYILV